MKQNSEGRCLGLIGGLGVGATIHYYQELVKAHDAAGLPLHLLIAHADIRRVFRHVQAGEPAQLAQYLAGLIGQLHAGGANVAAIPAVMPHFCIDELLAIAPLPLVNMLETVAEGIRARKLHRVALFGTRFSIETGLFGQLKGVAVVTPKPEEVDYIHNTYFQLALEAAGAEEHRTGLTKLAHTLLERESLDAIILAGTDLSVIFNEANTVFPNVDCSRLHIASIMRSLHA